jgi:hypothetical protein
VGSEYKNSQQSRANQIEAEVGIGMLAGFVELQERKCPQDHHRTKDLQNVAHKNLLYSGPYHGALSALVRRVGRTFNHLTAPIAHVQRRRAGLSQTLLVHAHTSIARFSQQNVSLFRSTLEDRGRDRLHHDMILVVDGLAEGAMSE